LCNLNSLRGDDSTETHNPGVVLVVSCVVLVVCFECVTCFSSYKRGLWDQNSLRGGDSTETLHVEYAERKIKYSILFMFSPFSEYSNLEYVHVLSNTGFTRQNALFIFLWLRPRNT